MSASPTKSDVELGSEAGATARADAAAEPAAEESFASASHAVLFASAESDVPLCDVCGAEVREDDEDGYAVTGRGLYVWSLGDEQRFEEPPLCSSCAAAVGVSAMGRWEIEEEEG